MCIAAAAVADFAADRIEGRCVASELTVRRDLCSNAADAPHVP